MQSLVPYLSLSIMATLPWMELIIVIPIGIAWGLNPVLVALMSFLGNILPIWSIIYLKSWFSRVWPRKFKLQKSFAHFRWFNQWEKGRKKASQLVEKYGIYGIAALAPPVTGVYIATSVALLFGISKKRILFWMHLSLFVWTVGTTVCSYYFWNTLKHFFHI